jgi:UDP-glucuronate decarboxylase
MGVKHHEPVNLGNPQEKTVMELAQIIKELTGSKSEIRNKPLPVDDPKRRLPDISKAKRLLDWTPKKDLIEGLTETIGWYREELKGLSQEKQAASSRP